MLEVNGRKVELLRFANGAARCTFWELCARPLGAADYLAIAGAVRVLILEDVPQLSASNYNEAKRFVTLIDALYEAKVRLDPALPPMCRSGCISRAPAPLNLNAPRRLREMQGAAWGLPSDEG